MNESLHRVFVVAGMHRSGTSALAHGLEVLGLPLGDSLMPPAPKNNDSGFFEDTEIVALNDKVFKRAGRTWHGLAPWDADQLRGPKFTEERLAASDLLRTRLDAHGAFAFKDPRLCLTLPLWQCVFDDLGVTADYIVCIRNPLEIAASLKARDDFPVEKGVRLWAQHMAHCLAAVRGKRPYFVRYDDLLSEPQETLKALAAHLELTPPDAEAARAYSERFIDTSKRHAVISDGELARSGQLESDHLALFDHLMAATSANAPDELPLPTLPDEAPSLLRLVDEGDDRRRLLERRLAEYGRKIAAAEEEKAEIVAREADLVERVAVIEEEKVRIEGALSEFRDISAKQLNEMMGQRDAVTKERDEALAASLRSEERLHKAKSEASELRSRSEETERRLNKRRDELRTKLTGTKAAITSLTGKLDVETRRRRQLKFELNQVRASTSWRLTAPLRSVGSLRAKLGRGTARLGRSAARLMWHAIPLPAAGRGKLARGLFRVAPVMFARTPQYVAWRDERDRARRAAPLAEREVTGVGRSGQHGERSAGARGDVATSRSMKSTSRSRPRNKASFKRDAVAL